jgi:tRNA (guanosine-2'-O-)-methyltransferase
MNDILPSTPPIESWFDVAGGRYPAHHVVEALSHHVNPQRIERLKAVLSQRLTSVVLGIEDLHHEHNGAACLRTAEGLGLHRVMAAEVRNAYPIPRAVSMSAHRWIEIETFKGGPALVHAAQRRGYRVYGASPRGDLTLSEIPTEAPLMVLFGNEADGLQEETMATCDGLFRIPMYGFTESFNISVSVGMVLEQVTARVRERISREGIDGELPAHDQMRLLSQWIARDMRGVELILRRYLGEPIPR